VRLRLSIHAIVDAATSGGSSNRPVRYVEVAFERGDVLFGRGANATVQLPYLKVSLQHAKLSRVADHYCLEDVGSRNGTRLSGRKLRPHVPEAIAIGESFEFGGVKIRLERESREADSPSEGAGTNTLARQLVRDLFAVGPPAESPRLVVLSGPESSTELPMLSSERVYRVGRSEECDLVLHDEDVSREHAAFERGPNGIIVRDLGSKNGIEVAGQPISGERRLRDGEIVRVGETRLQVVDPEDRYLRQIEVNEAGHRVDTVRRGESSGATRTPRASRLPAIAAAVAITVLVTTVGLVLALVFVSQL
jgi:pSer/pThr/pTyr-binding forkhead associated (FHA) protein